MLSRHSDRVQPAEFPAHSGQIIRHGRSNQAPPANLYFNQVGVGGESGQAAADDDQAKGEREPRTKVRDDISQVVAASNHRVTTACPDKG